MSRYVDEIVDDFNRQFKGTHLMAAVDKVFLDTDAVLFRFIDEPGIVIEVPLKAHYFSECTMSLPRYLDFKFNFSKIDNFIKRILDTPKSKLLSEPKYVVMPENLDSSRGPQCLTTDVTGRVFFAAKKNGLKQKFSFDELQEIINRTADGAGISWLTPVVNQYKKLVE